MTLTKPSYRELGGQYNSVKVTAVIRYMLDGPYYSFQVICPMSNDYLAPDFKLKREATTARRDFIALLKKHGWREERKSK